MSKLWVLSLAVAFIACIVFFLVLASACKPAPDSTVIFFDQLDTKRAEFSAAMLVAAKAPQNTRAEAISKLAKRQIILWEYVHWLEQVEAPDDETRQLVTMLIENIEEQAIGLHYIRIALASGKDTVIYDIESVIRVSELRSVDLIRYELAMRARRGVGVPMLPDA